MDQAKIASFRKKIVEDDAFRASFAKSPGDALRSIGIQVPKDAKFPTMDKAELDRQVDSFKKAAGGSLDKLLKTGEVSDKELESVAGGISFSPALTQNSLFRFSISLGQIETGGLRQPGGGIYKVSAFGTLDW
jgi:hypothetical protein